MGCGLKRLDGYVNVDKQPECGPDLQIDLEQLPWPLPSDAAEEVLFNHSLEHLGHDPAVFLGIMKELYRICRPGAKVQINVPHPRHDNFVSDPTHVRAITPMTLALFSRRNNLVWQASGAANSPLALYLDVDFETVRTEHVLEPKYRDRLQAGEISQERLMDMVQECNNIVLEYRFSLEVIKRLPGADPR